MSNMGQGGYPPPGYGGNPGYGAAGYGTPGVTYGQMGPRFVARLIDGVIVGAVLGILGAVLLGGAATQVSVDESTGQATGLGAFFAAYFGFLALAIVLGLAYEIGLIATRGATIGKQVMGLKVVSEQTGGVPGWGPAILRWLIPQLGGLVCGIGALVVLLSPLWDNTGRMQGWHDKVAKTLVLSTR